MGTGLRGTCVMSLRKYQNNKRPKWVQDPNRTQTKPSSSGTPGGGELETCCTYKPPVSIPQQGPEPFHSHSNPCHLRCHKSPPTPPHAYTGWHENLGMSDLNSCPNSVSTSCVTLDEVPNLSDGQHPLQTNGVNHHTRHFSRGCCEH